MADNLLISKNKSVYADGFDCSSLTNGGETPCVIGDLFPKHIDVDLEGTFEISRIVIKGVDFADVSYKVYVSADGVKFDKYGDFKTYSAEPKCELTAKAKGRIVRVLVTGNSQGAMSKAVLSQIEVYGAPLNEAAFIREKIEITDYSHWLREKHNIDLSEIMDEKGNYDPKDTYTENDTREALNGLVERILGRDYVDWFIFDIRRSHKGNDYFEISDLDGKIKIEGDCGVSIATGLNHYLKYFCKVQITQQTKQVKMPDSVVPVEGIIRQETPCKVRYAYNYCTHSYTMAFFGYEKWQRELDFLMLSGVNLILDITGTEAMWVSYLQKLGYNADQAKNYVSGPCYKAFWLMGNLQGYGGPVCDSWVIDTLELARTNQRYMTVMGAKPALQTFVGAMPESFSEIAGPVLLERGFEDIKPYMAPQGMWAEGFVRPNVLKTTYPNYSYLANLFYETQKEIYGCVTNYYCGDVCHEGGIVPEDLSKPEMSKKLLDELLDSDKNAVWILQAWWSNPMKEVLQGFGDNRAEHIMILDLASLANPRWTDETTWDGREFGKTPWIYCILDNYGGRAGMHGKLREMASLMDSAKKSAEIMAGIGITPEGTFANPIVYDLFWEMAWRNEAPDIDEWVNEYVLRRYGSISENTKNAWKLFEKTVYGVETIDGATKLNVIQENPSLALGYCRKAYHKIQYSRFDFEKGLKLLMCDYESLCNNQGFVYDAVDLMRMSLCIACEDYFDVLKTSFATKKKDIFKKYSKLYLSAMELLAEVCTYNSDELMGNWIYSSEDWMNDDRNGDYDDFHRDIMELNTRIIIADWASSPIQNYATRQYDGLIKDYFCKTWGEHLEKVNSAFDNGENPPEKMDPARGFRLGWEFSLNEKKYRRLPASVQGDEQDRGLFAVWQDVLSHMNGEETKAIARELFKEIENVEVKDELTAAIATNIEH